MNHLFDGYESLQNQNLFRECLIRKGSDLLFLRNEYRKQILKVLPQNRDFFGVRSFLSLSETVLKEPKNGMALS